MLGHLPLTHPHLSLPRSLPSAASLLLLQVRRSGTTADKVAAMSVLLQDGAVANLPSLDGLLGMVGKKGGEAAPLTPVCFATPACLPTPLPTVNRLPQCIESALPRQTTRSRAADIPRC